MYLNLLRASIVHFPPEWSGDKLTPGMVYHSKDYQSDWAEVADYSASSRCTFPP